MNNNDKFSGNSGFNESKNGNGMFFGEKRYEKHKRKIEMRNFFRTADFSKVMEWSWIDIIGVTITISFIIFVVINYDTVTDKLFMVLCPIISNLFVIVLIVGIIVLLVWIFRRRQRHYW